MNEKILELGENIITLLVVYMYKKNTINKERT